MANPQRENGHIDIANEIAEKLCSYRISGQEWQILWVILRKTWGWLEDTNNKGSAKKKMDMISLSQFTKMTGIDRRRCHYLLNELVEKNIIIKAVTNIDTTKVIRYGFQKDYDKWKVSPKKTPVTNIDTRVSPILTPVLSPILTPTKEKKETITKEIDDELVDELKKEYPSIDIDFELEKYKHWQAEKPPSKKHKDKKRGFTNWIKQADKWQNERASPNKKTIVDISNP